MARPIRIDYPGAFHHVTNRGARRQDIFYCDEDCLDFLRLIAKAHERFGIIAHSFCLMDNHVHLILETPEGGLSRALHLIESAYVQGFNRRHGLDGPLLKGRFYSRLIQEDPYLQNAIRYVERNPIEAGIVESPIDYPWSSYRLFIGGPDVTPKWLSSGALHDAGIKSAHELERFVMFGSPESLLDVESFGPVIGDDDFIAAALSRSNIGEQTIGHVRGAEIRPSAMDIDRAVSVVFDTPASRLRDRTQGTRADARLAAIGLQQDVAGKSLRFVARRFGYKTAQSAGVVATRFRRREHEDPDFALKVEQVRQLLRDGRFPRIAGDGC